MAVLSLRYAQSQHHAEHEPQEGDLRTGIPHSLLQAEVLSQETHRCAGRNNVDVATKSEVLFYNKMTGFMTCLLGARPMIGPPGGRRATSLLPHNSALADPP